MAFDQELACSVLKNVGELWLEERFSDLKISIGDSQFNCHRFQLCSCSAFFKVLLQSENKDAPESPIRHVTIKGISPATFGLVLKAIYKGENGLDKYNMIDVWHAVRELHIDVLTLKCEEFVINHMSLENYQSIYQNAVLLGSRSILEAVLNFMAGNFESFRDTQTFLDLPAKILLSVVSKDGLAVKSRDQLVDSILKWIRHVPDGDGENESKETKTTTAIGEAKRSVDDVRNEDKEKIKAQRSTSDQLHASSKDPKSVEVIFDAPPLPLSDPSGMRQLRLALLDGAQRKEWLDKLLKIAKLEEASAECLAELEKNDLVMFCKEARNTVRQAIAMSQISKQISSSAFLNTSSLPDSVLVMAFRSWGNEDDIFAYCLENKKIYHLESVTNLRDFYTCCDKLYCNTFYSSPYSHENRFAELSFPKNKILKINLHSTGILPVAVDDFLYCFMGDQIYRAEFVSEKITLSWSCVGLLIGESTPRSKAVFKDRIILFSTKPSSSEDSPSSTLISCFNTNTRRFHLVAELKEVQSEEITFIYKEHLYILFGNGMLWRVEELPESSIQVIPHYLSQGSESCQHYEEKGKLWDFDMPLYGAVVHNEELIIMADLSSVNTLPRSTPMGLARMQFVQVLTRGKAYPLFVSRKCLTSKT